MIKVNLKQKVNSFITNTYRKNYKSIPNYFNNILENNELYISSQSFLHGNEYGITNYKLYTVDVGLAVR